MFLFLAALLLSSCGNNTSESDLSSDKMDRDISASESAAVSDTLSENDNEEKTICTIRDDTAQFHNGTDFDDPELCRQLREYCSEITDKYDPMSDDEVDEWLGSDLPKGGYVYAEIKDAVTVYVVSKDDLHIRINDSTYLTEGESTVVYDHLKSYLKEHNPT